MAWYEVTGTDALEGEIKIQGSKNSVLPVLAAAILAEDVSIINNCPEISDVDNTITILRKLGCKVTETGHTVIVDARNITNSAIAGDVSGKMRSSVIFLGALLSRMGKAEITYPGGCKIGTRPIDMHISALRKMGVQIIEDGDIIHGAGSEADSGTRYRGEKNDCVIRLEKISVGTTENIMLAGVTSGKRIIIENAAREPEVIELQDFLNSMGAHVRGAGTGRIIITGVPKKNLRGTAYTIQGDRIVAATYLAALGMTSGSIYMRGIKPQWCRSSIDCFKRAGMKIREEREGILAVMKGGIRPLGAIKTEPYPGIATDIQPQLLALMTKAKGITSVRETIFEKRFEAAKEIVKMGGHISLIDDRTAVIMGNDRLNGTKVSAADLRAGAALIVAGLGAEGTTVVSGVEFIKRGYEDIARDISLLGGRIRLADEKTD